jgi:hypothetical protein
MKKLNVNFELNNEWFDVMYNSMPTNVQVTKFGDVRKVAIDWTKRNLKCVTIDDSTKSYNQHGYQITGIHYKTENGYGSCTVGVHQLIAAAFLGYKFIGRGKLVVDHIDSNPLNNSLDNLRVITQRENLSKERTQKSGLPVGVSVKHNLYQSLIHINKKLVYLGRYKTAEEASLAYQNKLAELKSGTMFDVQ